MRCERRRGAELLELLLLPVINIGFLLIPVLVVVIELTSFAALQVSTPDAARAAQAPATSTSSPSQDRGPRSTDPPAPTQSPLYPDPVLGYGF